MKRKRVEAVASPVAGRERRGLGALAGVGVGLGGVGLLAGVMLLPWLRTESDPEQLWRRARAEASAGAWQQVDATLDRLARSGPLTAEQWMLRANVDQELGHVDRALADLERIAPNDPLAATARQIAGQLELRRGRMPAAESKFLEAIALDPSMEQSHRELIFIYGMQLRRRDLDTRFRALSRLATLDQNQIFLWCLSRSVSWRPDEAAEDLARYVKADPNDRWSRLALADNLRRLGRLAEASEALAALPDDDPDALALRVEIALDRHDETAAISLLAQGPAEHPALARLRGRLALTRRDGPTAVRAFLAADASEPNDRETLFGLGAAFQLVGERDRAKIVLSRARNLDRVSSLLQKVATPSGKNNAELWFDLGSACKDAGLFPQALAWYRLVLAHDPAHAEVRQAILDLEASLKDTKT